MLFVRAGLDLLLAEKAFWSLVSRLREWDTEGAESNRPTSETEVDLQHAKIPF
jgi:hypothetical protein